MINRSLGGADYNEITPGVNIPLPGEGLYNKGMLVKVCGRVTAVNHAAKYFLVDDGSTVMREEPDGTFTGLPVVVKVIWCSDGDPIHTPAVGDFLDNIIGISSSEAVGVGEYARVIRLRYLTTPMVTGSTLSRIATLNWIPKDHASYHIYKSLCENGPFNVISTVGGGTYSDTGLTNGTTYYYKVSSIESNLESPGSQVLGLTPTGASPTVTSEFDAATSTYTYTVTCPENNEYSFGSFEVKALTPNASPTGPWTAQGANIGGIDQQWPFTSSVWDMVSGNAAASWQVAAGHDIPINTAAVAQFKLVVPNSEPAQGTVTVKGDDPASAVNYTVLVPSVILRNPPVSVINLIGSLGNGGWYVSPVTVSISATDIDNDYSKSFYKLDDIAPWAEYQTQIQVSSDGQHQVAAYSVDTRGNSENPISSTFKIDTTAPHVSGHASTKPNENGWYNSELQIQCTAYDMLSGLAAPQAAAPGLSVEFSSSVVDEGEAVSAEATATDNAGNVGSFTIDNLKIDKTPPEVTGQPSTDPNDKGWYTGDVQIDYTAVDHLSGIAAPEAAESEATIEFSQTVTAEGSAVTDTGSATDNAGNVGAFIVSDLKIDKTAPIINCQAATLPNAMGWYNSDVTINFTVSDAVSGLELPSEAEAGANITFTETVTAEGDNVSHTGSAIDKAGNIGSKKIENLKIDKTAPSINVISAPSGGNYIINYDTAVIRFTVSDSSSGIDGMPWATIDMTPTGGWVSPSSNRGDAVSVGGGIYEVRLSLQVVGAYTVKLNAKDKADNIFQSSVPISFTAAGFTVEWLPPISTMDIYVMQDGSTVPVKFRLLDPNNNSVYVNSYLYTVKVMDSANKVWKQLSVPAPDVANSGYIAVIKTKDANNVEWPVGDYAVTIEGPGIWDVVSGPYRSHYGLQLVEKGVAKGAGKR